MSEKYNEGKLPKLWDYLVKLHQENPQAFSSAGFLRANVAQVWKKLNDKTHCPNCGANMQEYVFKLDFFNALLLKKMSLEVQKRMSEGMSFTEANQVHVVTRDFHDCIRHRTTQCRGLGLIAKVQKEGGTTHDREKGWLITRRGFAALRDEPVPAEVTVFNNEIVARSEKMTTLTDVFRNYEGEYKDMVTSHDSKEWVHFGETHQGEML